MSMRIVIPQDSIQNWPALEALKLACQISHANCKYSIFANSEYGDVFENGTGTGIVGAIQNGQFDTSVPYFTPTYKRYRTITFSHIYQSCQVLAVTRAPKSVDHEINWNLTLAFQKYVWIAFTMALLLTALVTVVLATKRIRSLPASDHFTLYFKVFVQLLISDFERILMHKMRARVLIGAWLLTAVIINGSYAGQLFQKAVLTEPIMPFKDLPTLLRCLQRKECRLITFGINYSTFQLMPAEHKKDALVIPFDDLGPAVLKETDKYLVLIICDNLMPTMMSENKECSFYSSDLGMFEWAGFPMAKNSTYKRSLNKIVLLLREFGIDLALNKKYIPRAKCDQNEVRSVQPNMIVQTLFSNAMLFGFYGVGIVAALIAFAYEHLKYRFHK